MTQGRLESIPLEVQKQMSSLEIRIMQDIVMRIKVNGFSSATADWEITRLQQLGQSEENIRKWIKEALSATDEEVDRIFSDEVYSEYYGHERAYQVMGFTQIPFEQNEPLQQYIKAAAEQTKGTFQNLTASMGFAVRQPGTGNIKTKKLRTYYVETLDKAINDIHSGAFDYNTVLRRTIKELTDSGLRTIGYESASGRTTSTRVDVAARRAIMTGFRQVQAKINEQVMDDLHTEYVEVSYHVGARPTHQVWQGKVYHWDRGAKKDDDQTEENNPEAGSSPEETGDDDSPLEDVTIEYIENARPGEGAIVQEEGYDISRHSNEIETAQWLHDYLGGDIRLLRESEKDGIKTPDYLWKGKLWELKNTTTTKAANSALRSAFRQIKSNPGGVILNYGENNYAIDEVKKVIEKRVYWNKDFGLDIMILSNQKSFKVLRYRN